MVAEGVGAGLGWVGVSSHGCEVGEGSTCVALVHALRGVGGRGEGGTGAFSADMGGEWGACHGIGPGEAVA